MSHSSHRKAVRDPTAPLSHRASHARSCAIHVAARLGLKRDEVLAIVEYKTGLSLVHVTNEQDLLTAFDCLEALSPETILDN